MAKTSGKVSDGNEANGTASAEDKPPVADSPLAKWCELRKLRRSRPVRQFCIRCVQAEQNALCELRSSPDRSALDSQEWGPEFDGRRADAGRARALSAFIQDILSVDELNDEKVIAMLDRHLLGANVDAVDDAMRTRIREARKFVANLHLDIGREAVKSQKDSRRVELLDLLERVRDRVSLGPIESDCPGLGPLLVDDDETAPMTELDRVVGTLCLLDARLIGSMTDEKRELVRSVFAQLRSVRPPTLELSAAKISCGLGMFGDGGKSPRNVRKLYDSARTKLGSK